MYIRFTIVNARQDDPLKYSVHEGVFEKGALVKHEKHKNFKMTHSNIRCMKMYSKRGLLNIKLFTGNEKEGSKVIENC